MSKAKPLYMEDCYQKEFKAKVIKTGKNFVVLDKTAFYPEGGGQPSDQGILEFEGNQVEVTGVKKHKGEVRHMVKGEVPEEETEVKGKIDWERRHKLMRMHTAQHLVSAIVLEEHGATVSGNQIHLDKSRIDFNPIQFSQEDLDKIEQKSNEFIEQGVPVEISEMPREEVRENMTADRVNLDLIPDSIDPLRVVQIKDLDICPCGGTHVKNLKEIGEISILGRESKGKKTDRVTFELSE